MTIDLEAIRAAALAATPGPWECKRAERNEYWINTGPEARLHLTKWSGMCSVYGQDDADDDMSNAVVSANAHHIATMDPQTTLALVERVRELESVVREVGRRSESYEEWALSWSWAQGQVARLEANA